MNFSFKYGQDDAFIIGMLIASCIILNKYFLIQNKI